MEYVMKDPNRYPPFDKETTTFGQKYGPAMLITDPADAVDYLERCIEHTMAWGADREAAEKIELANIGYWTGYYGGETAARVQRLFGAEHPIFGATQPSPEEAFKMGMDFGAALKRGQANRPT